MVGKKGRSGRLPATPDIGAKTLDRVPTGQSLQQAGRDMGLANSSGYDHICRNLEMDRQHHAAQVEWHRRCSSQGRDPDAPFRFVDLFCGIGGFHLAAADLGLHCVFACDIDAAARKVYRHNLGLEPAGDITLIQGQDIPDHELLFAGFPCQPFSIIGKRKGLADPRGNLFGEILRVIRCKRPLGIVLENVRQLVSIHGGMVLRQIQEGLEQEGYTVDCRVLNARDFGLPQKRDRTIIVATRMPFLLFPWPVAKIPMTPLSDLLESNPHPRHYASPRIRQKRQACHTSNIKPSIWHENKGGNVSSHPWSCALRAGASYNYLLVDGERRLTPREMLRLQGFPNSFEIMDSDSQVRKQAGNAVPVPMAKGAIQGVVHVIRNGQAARTCVSTHHAIPAG